VDEEEVLSGAARRQMFAMQNQDSKAATTAARTLITNSSSRPRCDDRGGTTWNSWKGAFGPWTACGEELQGPATARCAVKDLEKRRFRVDDDGAVGDPKCAESRTSKRSSFMFPLHRDKMNDSYRRPARSDPTADNTLSGDERGKVIEWVEECDDDSYVSEELILASPDDLAGRKLRHERVVDGSGSSGSSKAMAGCDDEGGRVNHFDKLMEDAGQGVPGSDRYLDSFGHHIRQRKDSCEELTRVKFEERFDHASPQNPLNDLYFPGNCDVSDGVNARSIIVVGNNCRTAGYKSGKINFNKSCLRKSKTSRETSLTNVERSASSPMSSASHLPPIDQLNSIETHPLIISEFSRDDPATSGTTNSCRLNAVEYIREQLHQTLMTSRRQAFQEELVGIRIETGVANGTRDVRTTRLESVEEVTSREKPLKPKTHGNLVSGAYLDPISVVRNRRRKDNSADGDRLATAVRAPTTEGVESSNLASLLYLDL